MVQNKQECVSIEIPSNYENFDDEVLDEFAPSIVNQDTNEQNENIVEDEIENDFRAQNTAFSNNNKYLAEHKNYQENYSVQ